MGRRTGSPEITDSSIVPATSRYLAEQGKGSGLIGGLAGAGSNFFTRPDMFERPSEMIDAGTALRGQLIPSHTIEILASGVSGMLDGIMASEEAKLGAALLAVQRLANEPEGYPTTRTVVKEGRDRSALSRLLGGDTPSKETTIIDQKAPYLKYDGGKTVFPHAEIGAARTLTLGEASASAQVTPAGEINLTAFSRGGNFHTSINQGREGGGSFSQNVAGPGGAYAEAVFASVSAGEITQGGEITMGYK